jgi:hypothetical protein
MGISLQELLDKERVRFGNRLVESAVCLGLAVVRDPLDQASTGVKLSGVDPDIPAAVDQDLIAWSVERDHKRIEHPITSFPRVEVQWEVIERLFEDGIGATVVR